jgi:hypothetical protein
LFYLFYVFSYLVSCYFAFILLRKNQKEKTKKKKEKKTAPTAASKGGRLKETAVSSGGSCLPACRHPNRPTAS